MLLYVLLLVLVLYLLAFVLGLLFCLFLFVNLLFCVTFVMYFCCFGWLIRCLIADYLLVCVMNIGFVVVCMFMLVVADLLFYNIAWLFDLGFGLV